jgi:23S rRNA (adenine2503-C2)-methyltransferase
VQTAHSEDTDTVKLVLRTRDGAEIETVRLGTPRRVTLCISSQVGCGFGCTFCRTATMGFGRNLEPGEIVDQILHVHRQAPLPDRYNLVFMGMGEPLANLDHVIRATDLMQREEGLSIGPRRITVSTVGLVPEIERLARERPRLRLAVSLTATTDAQRSALMPIGKRYPLDRLLEAVAFHVRHTRRRVTFEYVLLAGVNDSQDDARRLARLSARVPCKVNLIPYNGAPGDRYRSPAPEVVERFRDYLMPRTYAVTVRATQGRDILAACGQLARTHDLRRSATR